MKAITDHAFDGAFSDLRPVGVTGDSHCSDAALGGARHGNREHADFAGDDFYWPGFSPLPAAAHRDANARILNLSMLAAVALEQLGLMTPSYFNGDASLNGDLALDGKAPLNGNTPPDGDAPRLAHDVRLSETRAAGPVATVLAYVRNELDELERTGEFVLGSLPETPAMGTPDVVFRAYTSLARIARQRTRHSDRAGRNDGRLTGRRGGERLSAREGAVLGLIAQGLSNKRVAQELKITPETVKSHLKRIFAKLGSKTRAEAVAQVTELSLSTGLVARAVASYRTALSAGDSRAMGLGQSGPQSDGQRRRQTSRAD